MIIYNYLLNIFFFSGWQSAWSNITWWVCWGVCCRAKCKKSSFMTFVTVHNITVVHVINKVDSQMLQVTHSHVLSPRLVTIKFYCFCKTLISCSQEDSLNCIFQMFILGGSAPRSNPTHLYTIFHEKGTPFVYLLLTNGTPFTYLV